MKNYAGKKWCKLTEEEKGILLLNANAVDGATGNTMLNDGDCIIDLTENLSINGRIEDGEIVIHHNAIIYDPAQGVYAAQEEFDKNNTVQKKLKLNKRTDKDILDKLESLDNMQGYIKELIRKDIDK